MEKSDPLFQAIVALASGQVALAVTILDLLVKKGVLTADEVLTAIEANQETAGASILPAVEEPLRSARKLFLALQQKPIVPR